MTRLTEFAKHARAKAQHAYAIFRELGLQNRTEAVYLLARMGVRFR